VDGGGVQQRGVNPLKVAREKNDWIGRCQRPEYLRAGISDMSKSNETYD
jgi:hypothetical protein